MKVKTRAISEGAMILAIMSILLIINRQFASMLELLFFVLSVPIIIYSVKHGLKMGIVVSGSALLITLMISVPTSIFYVACALLIGLIYSYGVLHNYKNSCLLFYTTVGNVFVSVITVLLLGTIFGYHIQDEIQFFLNVLPSFQTLHTIFYDYIVLVVLWGYVALAFMQAIIIHLLSLRLLQQLHIKEMSMDNHLITFLLPKYMIIIGLMSFVVYLLSSLLGEALMIKNIALFIFAIFLFIYIVDGCISLLCYFQQRKLNRGIVLLILIATLLPVVQLLIAMIGIYDIACAWRMKMKVGVHYEIH